MAWCFYCKRTLNEGRMLRRGDRNKGLDTRENKIPCCHRCNNLKGDMNANEFFQYVERYGYERQPRAVTRMMKHDSSYRGNW